MTNKEETKELIDIEKKGMIIPMTIGKYGLFYHLSKQPENIKRTYNIAWDAKNIYEHIVFTGILQSTNQVWANNKYLCEGLNITEERITQGKRLLVSIDLLQIIKTNSTEKGKFGKTYLKVLTTDPLSTAPLLNQERFKPVTVQTGSKCLREEPKCLREEINYYTDPNGSDNNNSLDSDIPKLTKKPRPKRITIDPNLPKKSIADNILNLIKNNYLTLPNVAKHKIDKPTKLLNNIIKLINSLLEGDFQTYTMKNYNSFDKEYFNKNSINKLLTKKFTEDEIITMFKNINLYYDQNYYPHCNNEKKPSLETLLFNERTGKSIALKLFIQAPKLGNEHIKAMYPEHIEKKYRTIAFGNYKFSKQDDINFKIALNNFYTAIQKKLTLFKDNRYNVSIPDSLFHVHAVWIRDFVSAANYSPCNIISATNGFWDSFNTYIQGTYNCTLEPSDKVLRQSLKKWEREQEQIAKSKINNEKRKAEFIGEHCF